MITRGIILFLTLTVYAIEDNSVSAVLDDTAANDDLGLIRHNDTILHTIHAEARNSTKEDSLSIGALKSGIGRSKSEDRGYGCRNGFCWTYCSTWGQWCFTSKYSGDIWYARCNVNSDCNYWMNCAGTCNWF